MFFPESVRKRIEDLACEDPATMGWSITHWSQRDLAQAALEQEYVDAIDHTTVGQILRDADLHPHRFRYWKTTIWDEDAVERACQEFVATGRGPPGPRRETEHPSFGTSSP